MDYDPNHTMPESYTITSEKTDEERSRSDQEEETTYLYNEKSVYQQHAPLPSIEMKSPKQIESKQSSIEPKHYAVVGLFVPSPAPKLSLGGNEVIKVGASIIDPSLVASLVPRGKIEPQNGPPEGSLLVSNINSSVLIDLRDEQDSSHTPIFHQPSPLSRSRNEDRTELCKQIDEKKPVKIFKSNERFKLGLMEAPSGTKMEPKNKRSMKRRTNTAGKMKSIENVIPARRSSKGKLTRSSSNIVGRKCKKSTRKDQTIKRSPTNQTFSQANNNNTQKLQWRAMYKSQPKLLSNEITRSSMKTSDLKISVKSKLASNEITRPLSRMNDLKISVRNTSRPKIQRKSPVINSRHIDSDDDQYGTCNESDK